MFQCLNAPPNLSSSAWDLRVIQIYNQLFMCFLLSSTIRFTIPCGLNLLLIHCGAKCQCSKPRNRLLRRRRPFLGSFESLKSSGLSEKSSQKFASKTNTSKNHKKSLSFILLNNLNELYIALLNPAQSSQVSSTALRQSAPPSVFFRRKWVRALSNSCWHPIFSKVSSTDHILPFRYGEYLICSGWCRIFADPMPLGRAQHLGQKIQPLRKGPRWPLAVWQSLPRIFGRSCQWDLAPHMAGQYSVSIGTPICKCLEMPFSFKSVKLHWAISSINHMSSLSTSRNPSTSSDSKLKGWVSQKATLDKILSCCKLYGTVWQENQRLESKDIERFAARIEARRRGADRFCLCHTHPSKYLNTR